MKKSNFRKTSGVNAGMAKPRMKKKALHVHKHEHKDHVGPSRAVTPPRMNIVGCRIKHSWKENSYTPVSQWTGIVLEQIAVNPSLFLIKYDGFDCVYGLEILRDERVQDLEIFPDKIALNQISDVRLAERMLGRTVEHQFETADGSKDSWRGVVLARAHVMPSWFFITYERDPVLYMYQLLDDFNEGDLQILQTTDSDDSEPRQPGEAVESLVGKQVEYVKDDGTQRTGTVIYRVEAKPSFYFIKYDDDYHIYVYDYVYDYV